MAQFIAFNPNVEVNGQTILSVVYALSAGQERRLTILRNHGIEPNDGGWYKQQMWLNAFQEIAHELGDKTLFMIGKAIPEHAQFPPQIDNLQKALAAIDMAYRMNHRGGEIGYYTVLSFDEKSKKAVMLCKNPYPSEFDRGIICTMLRRFKPKESFKYDVELDLTKETRLKGAASCTYNVWW